MVEVAHSIDLNLPDKLGDREYRQKFFLAESSAEIAAQLIALRKRRDLNQQQVAELIGTQQPAISRIEKADYQSWSFSILRKIADALDARIRVLIEPSEDIVGEYSENNAVCESEHVPVPEAEIVRTPTLLNYSDTTGTGTGTGIAGVGFQYVPNALLINGGSISQMYGALATMSTNAQFAGNQLIANLQRETAEQDKKIADLIAENKQLRARLAALDNAPSKLGVPGFPLFDAGSEFQRGF
jgi:transcriptional regulator with XRE-family HTH domain